MVEGVSERVDTPTDRMRLRVGCSTVVIFCCRSGGDHANVALELRRRLTRRLTERTGEVGLARKFEGQRNMGQRLVPLPEQLFGELKPLRADIVMRKRAHAQSASIKPCLSCTGGDIARQRADVVLDQPCEPFGGTESLRFRRRGIARIFARSSPR
jgi:hypothetical protein